RRLAPADLVRDAVGSEGLPAARASEDVERRGRVVEVRDDGGPVALGEPAQQRAVVRRELRGAPERPAMGVDQGAAEARRQRRLVQPELTEEVGEAIERRDLAVVQRAEALGLPPARAE